MSRVVEREKTDNRGAATKKLRTGIKYILPNFFPINLFYFGVVPLDKDVRGLVNNRDAADNLTPKKPSYATCSFCCIVLCLSEIFWSGSNMGQKTDGF
jgi:hypothetical protein